MKFLGLTSLSQIAGASFAAGVLISGGGAFALSNTIFKASKVKSLEQTVERQQQAILLSEYYKVDVAEIISRKDSEILSLQDSNEFFSNRSNSFSNQGMKTLAGIVERGNEIKNDVSSSDACATSVINAGLLEYGNGSDFDPASVSTQFKVK